MRGPLWATLIHTLALTFQVQRTLSFFRHVLPTSVLRSSKVTRVRLRNHELNVNGLSVNGLNYSAAKKREL